MSVTVFIDESGTHKGAVRTLLSAVLIEDALHVAIQNRWDLLLRCYGLTYLHAVDLYSGRNTVKNLHYLDTVDILNAVAEYTARFSLFSVVGVLVNSDYDMHYKIKGVPSKVRLDSKYGLLFRNILSYACERLAEHPALGFPPLNVVVEAGHKNANELRDIFQELQGTGYEPFCSMLKSFRFGTKDDHCGLQMADLLVYPMLKLEANTPPQSIGTDVGVTLFEDEHKGVVVRMPLTAGQIAEQRENLEELYQIKRRSPK